MSKALVQGSIVLALICGSARADSPTAADFQATRNRPLFSPTRRPPPPLPPTPVATTIPSPLLTPPPAPPPDVVLSGIIIGGGSGSAIVRRATDAAATRVTLGGQVDGWTVADIRPRSIVLRRGDRSVTLDLPTAR